MMWYLGITVGPVLRTLMMGVRTKELFAASYIHSLLSKTIIDYLKNNAFGEIISPAWATPDKSANDKKIGVGLYPDRIFFRYNYEATRINKELLRQDVLGTFIKTLDITDKDNFIRNYFKIYMTECESETEVQAVTSLNDTLDILELHTITPADDCGDMNPIEDIINNPGQNQNLWSDAFGKDKLIDSKVGKIIPFPDLETIAECRYTGKEMCYHRYVCVVQADGDNMGKMIRYMDQIKKTEPKMSILEFSENMLEFGKTACDIIRTGEYDPNRTEHTSMGENDIGLPIYAGGDDLLFIAPVAYQVEGKVKTIFHLLHELDTAYSEIVAKKRVVTEKKDQKATEYRTHMSYGISIAYCKRPLYESFVDAREQLFAVAKKIGGRNCIAWELRKHGGSTVNGVLKKNSIAASSKDQTTLNHYDKFIALLEATQEDDVVTAVCHKIRAAAALMPLFDKYAKSGNAQGKEDPFGKRLGAFFQKYLDAAADENKLSNYHKAVKELMVALWKEGRKPEDLAKNMYDLLRTARFVKGIDQLHETE